MMSENWAICHDNGVAGRRGVSDGYASRDEAEEAAKQMTDAGGVVYDLWRTA